MPGLPDGIPIAGIAGDQQAALFGQACFAPGEAKCTYGTGAFLLMNTGTEPVASTHGLLTTVAWQIGDEVDLRARGQRLHRRRRGAVAARRARASSKRAAEIEALAASVPDSGGVVFVPALAGLGAPHWRPEARGLISGLDARHHQGAPRARGARGHRAADRRPPATPCEADVGRAMPTLKVDGGAAANDLLMQFQADLLRRADRAAAR